VRSYALPLLPGALLLAVAAALAGVPAWRESVRPFLPAVPPVTTAAGVLLGLRLGNVRVVVAFLVLALAGGVLARSASLPWETMAAAALVPLNLGVLAWTSDRGRSWPRLSAWLAVVVLQAFAVWVVPALPAAWLGGLVVTPTTAAAAVLAASGLGLLLGIVRFAARPRPTEAGLLWALAVALVAVAHAGDPVVRTLALATGALTLLVALVETSHALAYRDELTGLPGRRAFERLLSSLGPRYAVAMVDIDHFKKFNDTWGHQAGDQLLRKVAATLMGVTGGGRPFRYGGEEFAVVFPGLDTEAAVPHLERLREAVAETGFTVRGPGRPRRKPRTPSTGGRRHRVSVTVSIGVADSTTAGRSPAEVMKAADAALYRAKRAGRNRLAV
jgi:diguanylate cyclase (GGDEF)-like protein